MSAKVYHLCLLMRFAVAAWVRRVGADERIIVPIGAVTLLQSVTFAALYLGVVKRDRGAFGQTISWNHMRPLHALLYAVTAATVFSGKGSYAWLPLLLDVLLSSILYAPTV